MLENIVKGDFAAHGTFKVDILFVKTVFSPACVNQTRHFPVRQHLKDILLLKLFFMGRCTVNKTNGAIASAAAADATAPAQGRDVGKVASHKTSHCARSQCSVCLCVCDSIIVWPLSAHSDSLSSPTVSLLSATLTCKQNSGDNRSSCLSF